MNLQPTVTKKPDVRDFLPQLAFAHYIYGELILLTAFLFLIPAGITAWIDRGYPHIWTVSLLFYFGLAYLTLASIAAGMLLIVSGWCIEHHVGRKFSMVISGFFICWPILGTFMVLVFLMVLHNPQIKNLYNRPASRIR